MEEGGVQGEGHEEIRSPRREEGGCRSIEAIAIKLVTSAEQGRRLSQEEEEEEEEGRGREEGREGQGFTFSSNLLPSLTGGQEPSLVNTGIVGGRKSL